MSATVNDIEVRFTCEPGRSYLVGNLAVKNFQLFWEYSPAWLASGVELSPFILPLKPNLIEHTDRQFGPLFGL